MSSDTDQFFLDRIARRALIELLREIPGLVDDLAVTITRRDRTGTGRARGGAQERWHALPYNAGASDVHDTLRAELAGWARHVCEYRGLRYDGGESTAAIAVWLDRHVIALAMTEGSEEALPAIQAAVRQARRVIDLPDEDQVPVDTDRLEQALALELNARGCAQAAHAAGIILTQRRVKYLADTGVIRPVRIAPDGARVFRLGEVLDAHRTHPAA